MFGDKYTEIILSNGTSHVVLGNYEKVLDRFFDDSGNKFSFVKMEKGYINVNQIVEIKDYREE